MDRPGAAGSQWTGYWLLRPILWFATAYTINIILHESTHALTARCLGFRSTLFNLWVNPELTQATTTQRAMIATAGPVASLCVGLLCWLAYGKARNSSAGMPLAYLSSFGLTIFFGNLLSASFVGDFSIAAVALGLPMAARYLVSLIGALSVGVILFFTGRELRRWAPRQVGRIAGAIGTVALPALVGTALVILVNQPLPASFVAARVGEGSVWVVAAVGALTGRDDPASSDTGLQLRWADCAVAIVVVLLVRFMAQGISLIP